MYRLGWILCLVCLHVFAGCEMEDFAGLAELRGATPVATNQILANLSHMYRDDLIRVLEKTGLSHEDAEEIWNSTLLEVWNRPVEFQYKHKNSEWAYLRQIAEKNRLDFIDKLKTQKRDGGTMAPIESAHLMRDRRQLQPPDLLINEENRRLFYAEVDNPDNGLSPFQRAAFKLWLSGATGEEIAAKTGAPAHSVSAAVVKAKKKLTDSIQSRYPLHDTQLSTPPPRPTHRVPATVP